MENKFIRRSISIPFDINNRIDTMIEKYSYDSKNELFIELLELGLLKFDEDIELKSRINKLINMLDILLERIK